MGETSRAEDLLSGEEAREISDHIPVEDITGPCQRI